MKKSMGKILISTLVLIAFLSGAAFGAIQNIIFEGNSSTGYDNNAIFTINWTDTNTTMVNDYTIYVMINNVTAGSVAPKATGTNTSTTGYAISGLSNGSYTVYIMNGTVAASGVVNVTSLNITVDTINPTSSVSSPANNSNQSNGTLTIALTATDNNATNPNDMTSATKLNYTVYINGVGNATGVISNATETGVSIEGLTNGSHWYQVQITDNATNAVNSTNRTLLIDTVKPNTTSITTTKSTYTKGETVSATCSATDNLDTSMQLNISLTRPSPHGGLVKTSTGTSFTHSFADDEIPIVGTYTIQCKAADDANNTNTTSISFTVEAAASGGSGGGGSATVVKEDGAVKVTVTPGSPAKAVVTDQKVPVKEISITASQGGTASVVVKTVATNPVSTTPAAKVYNYLDIEVKDFNKSAITSAKVKFTVTKSWVADNNIDHTKVALYRNVNGQWTKLATTLLSEDAASYTFEAETPGFSYFAVGGEEKQAQVTPVDETNDTDQTTGTDTTEDEVDVTETDAQSKRLGKLGIVLLVVAVAAVGYYLYTRYGNTKRR